MSFSMKPRSNALRNGKRKKIKIPRLPIRKILVPIDFSPHSNEVMKYASAIAKAFNATIILMHVVDSATYSVTDTFNVVDRRRPLETIARTLLDNWAEQINGGVSVQPYLATGFAYQEILKKTEKDQVDLIVMGTHGRTGLGHFLLGSVTEKVVRMAPCPVLTVRLNDQAPKATAQQIKRREKNRAAL
jgi:nucleotide-binding universal stress UspA family protein